MHLELKDCVWLQDSNLHAFNTTQKPEKKKLDSESSQSERTPIIYHPHIRSPSTGPLKSWEKKKGKKVSKGSVSLKIDEYFAPFRREFLFAQKHSAAKRNHANYLPTAAI